MIAFIHHHVVPSPWTEKGLAIWCSGEQDAPPGTAPKSLMPYWVFYLNVLEASRKYRMDDLEDKCLKALVETDIFSNPHVLSPLGLGGRTNIGHMLHYLYEWAGSCVKRGSLRPEDMFFLENILSEQVPKMVDLLKRTDDGLLIYARIS